MAQEFLSDTFDGPAGQEITGRSATVGGTWNPHPEHPHGLRITNLATPPQRLRGDGGSDTNHAIYLNTAIPPGPDQRISGTIHRIEGTSNSQWHFVLRYNDQEATGYRFSCRRISGNNNEYRIYLDIEGVATTIAGPVTVSFPIGESREMTGEIIGDQLRLLVDDIEILSEPDDTITSAGFVGVGMTSGASVDDTRGYQLADVSAESLGASLEPGEITFMGLDTDPPEIRIEETQPPTGVTGTLNRQWRRRANDGEFADLSGETGASIADTDVTASGDPKPKYDYQIIYTDDESSAESNVITLQVYEGGLIGEAEVTQEDIDAIAAKVVSELSALATTDPLASNVVSYDAGLSPAEALDDEMVGGGSIRQAIGTAASMAVGRIRRNPDNQNEWLLYAWNNPSVVIATITSAPNERTSVIDESIQPPE